MTNFAVKLVLIVLIASCFFAATVAGSFMTSACIAACAPLMIIPSSYGACIAACISKFPL